MVLDHTTRTLTADGSVQFIDDSTEVSPELLNEGESSATDSFKGIYERTVKKFADQAYRTLLITYRDMSMSEYESIKAGANNFEDESDK